MSFLFSANGHLPPEQHTCTVLASELVRRTLIVGLGSVLFIALQFGNCAAGVMITADLSNFDVRYPTSLPNDLEIVMYGDGLKTGDVAESWNSSLWGLPGSTSSSVNSDPTSLAFGLNCVVVRYVGPPRPDAVGTLTTFGVRRRLGAVTIHQEVWWSINGQRILRPCDPQAIWTCTTNGWLIGVANPTPAPMYLYGTRYFSISNGVPLPSLSQLSTSINPAQFGTTNWTSLALPGNVTVFCLQPWCRIYFRVPSTTWRPIVFQVAARNVPENVLPLPTGTTGPNPNDFNGENGTMAILTTRPTQEYAEDLNGDGVVGIPDFNQLRTRFSTRSQDAP